MSKYEANKTEKFHNISVLQKKESHRTLERYESKKKNVRIFVGEIYLTSCIFLKKKKLRINKNMFKAGKILLYTQVIVFTTVSIKDV